MDDHRPKPSPSSHQAEPSHGVGGLSGAGGAAAHVPHPAVRRLSLYLRQLDLFRSIGLQTVSSKQLGESLGLTDAQVRKDLAYFGTFGHPGVGYRVDDLIARVRRILGTDRSWNVALIGAGNLGRALLAYHGFESRGFIIAAVLDADAGKVGTTLGPHRVRPMDQLEATLAELDIRIAILAVPAEPAQSLADRLVAAGIRGLLSFAPIQLNVPPGVAISAVDLAVQLEQLSFVVSSSDDKPLDPASEEPRVGDVKAT